MAPMQRNARAAGNPAPAGTVLHHTRADAPVFAALADQWRSAGRMVPGQADPEWSTLTTRIPRVTLP
ncbi:hypothetical protein [Actinacidiphila paucisporea]|uniref:Uncharacterized protein n=1 Tax=Actinacidiphila paucisporea TaxID=310782 RepID=A0A1M7AS48_9ACTN|nr:hypothetical protein [Actinacidiphila paucisporea]SHL45487.1 hypothetical protein SAMN05216499_104176 [Actinacidiphila paucisporea]